MNKIVSIVALTIMLSLPLLSWAIPLSFSGTIFTGPINGFVQTPTGGQPGTSSLNRPTFKELGITCDNSFDLSAAIWLHQLKLYAGWQIMQPHGTRTLQNTLISHGVVIPAGTSIRTQLKFDWYRLGGSYDFHFSHNKLKLSPIVEAAVLNFDYHILGYIIPRHYYQKDLRVGLGAAYSFSKRLNLHLSAIAGLPFFYWHLNTATIKLNYIPKATNHIQPIFFVGVEYLQSDFKDRQTLPNHIKYQAWPRVLGGVTVRI